MEHYEKGPTLGEGTFGRVFAGTIKTGQKVKIMGPNYTHGQPSPRTDAVPSVCLSPPGPGPSPFHFPLPPPYPYP